MRGVLDRKNRRGLPFLFGSLIVVGVLNPYPYTAKAVHVLVHGSEGARACNWTTNDSTSTR